MWRYMILSLLCFGPGHAFPRLENQAVYEIQEDKGTNTLKFVNPDSKKPILREITYFHVVEKAYDDTSIPLETKKDVKDTIDSEEEVKTERPFTNGHGYQFIDYFPIVINDTKLSNADDLVKWVFSDSVEDDEGANDNEGTNDNEDINADNDDDNAGGDEEYYEDVEIDTGDAEEDRIIGEDDKPVNIIENASALTKQTPIAILRENKIILDKLTAGENELNKDNVTTILDKNNEIELVTEESPLNTTGKVETTRKITRHRQLFDSPEKLKERYQKMKNFVKVNEPAANGHESEEETNGRPKRTARLNMPEAPTLPALNYDGLPDFIKSVHFTEERSDKKKQRSNNEYHNNGQEHLKEEIRKKMEYMFDNISPGDSVGQKDKITHLNFKESEANTPNKGDGTYGMRLTGNSGYVWNNLWSNSAPTFSTGDLQNVENSKETEANKEESTPHKLHTTPKPSIYKEHKPEYNDVKKVRVDASFGNFEKTEEVGENEEKYYNYQQEKLKEDIKRKMEDMFDNMNNKDTEREDEIVHKNTEDSVINIPTNKDMKYGMNLMDGHGYVWNDLVGNPGLRYNMGELETVQVPKEAMVYEKESTKNSEIETTTEHEQRPRKHHTTEKPGNRETQKPVHIKIPKDEVDTRFGEFAEVEDVGKNEEKHYNDQQEEIKRKLKDIFDGINPEDGEKEDVIEHMNTEDGIINIPTNKVRTYGMTLKGDHGVVWNDLWSNPGIRYNIGNLETVEESKEIEANKEEFEKPEPERTTTHKPPTTAEPSIHEEQNPVHHNNRPNANQEIDDIFVNIDKDENKKELHTDQTLPTKKPEKESKPQTPEIEQRPATDDTKEDLKPLHDEDKEIDKDKIPQTLDDLINNEQLWKWLSDWMETYMSLLTEYILKVVKAEVAKQMENSIKENIPLDHANEKEEIKKDDVAEEIQNKKEEVDDKVELEKQSDVALDENNEDKDDKNSEKETIFVNGVEYPLTNTSNIADENKLDDDDEDLLRNRKNKDDKKEVEILKKNETNKEVKVVAKNIYGNSLEADKVTNIFFFFGSDRIKEAVEIIKPLLNEKNGSSSENIIVNNKIESLSTTEDKPKPENPENSITEEKKFEVIKPTSEAVNENEKYENTKEKPSLLEKEPSASEDDKKENKELVINTTETQENLITEENKQPNSEQGNENEKSEETKEKPSLLEKETSTSDINKNEDNELVINTTENSIDEQPLVNENYEIEVAGDKEKDDKTTGSTTEDSISKPVDENNATPSTDEKDTNESES